VLPYAATNFEGKAPFYILDRDVFPDGERMKASSPPLDAPLRVARAAG